MNTAREARHAHAELQSRSAHWTKPLQSRLVQLEAPMQVLIADEQLLFRHVLHVVVRGRVGQKLGNTDGKGTHTAS
jgi:hypothetical protein